MTWINKKIRSGVVSSRVRLGEKEGRRRRAPQRRSVVLCLKLCQLISSQSAKIFSKVPYPACHVVYSDTAVVTFAELHVTAQFGPIIPVLLCYLRWYSSRASREGSRGACLVFVCMCVRSTSNISAVFPCVHYFLYIGYFLMCILLASFLSAVWLVNTL